MEERQVTIDGETHPLPKPFMVMATQNPVEYSGTFPLPEAQLDRFLMKVRLGYLSEKEEANLLGQHKVESPMLELQPVVSPNELKAAQGAVREVFVKPELREYIARLVGRTRGNPEVALGASTRGTLNLFHASQALAYALCLLFLVAWAWPRVAIRGMTFTRRLNPGTPTVGESFEEAIEVRRQGWVPAPWVEVRDLSQIPDYQPGRVISVSGELVKWKSRGNYRRRGWMAFGPTSLRVREPFGLFDKELKLTQRTSVLVYPRVRPIPDLLTPSAQQVGNSPSFGAWADYPPETR